MHTLRVVPIGLATIASLSGPAAFAKSKEAVVYNFAGGTGGSGPIGGLLLGPKGSFFGTTGDAPGVAFQLLPPTAHAGWTEAILHSFQSSPKDGSAPAGTLIADAAGDLYGVTSYGGAYGLGTVFELLPPANGRAAWSEAVLYSFAGGADGSIPFSTLLLDPAGNLFGTTTGDNIAGQKVSTAFELSPPASAGLPWTHTVIHSFDQPQDGRNAIAGFTAGPGGVLYSVTEFGGSAALGTAYQLTPPAQPGGPWAETILYSFQKHGDASLPTGELTADASGALFGTSGGGGSHFSGSVFKLTPPAPGQTAWTETILHSFDQSDGQSPLGKLLMSAKGALYGTTSDAGTYNAGTVFMLSPPAGNGSWRETVLHQFDAEGSDSDSPQAGVTFNRQGAIFGTSLYGGTTNQGTVFEVAR